MRLKKLLIALTGSGASCACVVVTDTRQATVKSSARQVFRGQPLVAQFMLSPGIDVDLLMEAV